MKHILTLLFTTLCLSVWAQTPNKYLYLYSDNRAVIKRDSLYGFADAGGRVVIPCRYTKAYAFNDGIAMVRQRYEVFGIDTLGNRLDVRVKIPYFLRSDLSGFAAWVWSRIPFESTDEFKRLNKEIVNSVITIGKDGTIVDIEDFGSSDGEAFAKVREVVMNAPKWTPGEVGREAVEIRYPLSVDFGKLHPVECYMVDEQGRRLHRDFTYPKFKETHIADFSRWFFKNIKYKRSTNEYGRATSGSVYAAFTIDAKGRLCDIEILDSHNGVCSKKVVETLQKSPRWQPAISDGKPVAVRYEYPFVFKFRR